MLVDRVRKGLSGQPVSEKRMFGGITFMLNGNMLCCASKKGLMVRVGKEAEPKALLSPHAQPCSGAGHRMPGFILVDEKGLKGDRALKEWLDMAKAYVGTLPSKPFGKTTGKARLAPSKAKASRG